MKTLIQLIPVLMLVSASLAAEGQNGHDLFQKALRKERVEGDLKGALALYEQIAKEPAGDRVLAARALLQLGKGFERLGADEARKAYEQLVTDYSEQTKEVTEARERLKSLNEKLKEPEQPMSIQKLVPAKSGHWDHWVSFGDARPSPDGRYYGYVNWSHGNLAICDIQTGEVRDLTTEGTWAGPDQFSWCPAWSPDSQQIAYLWIKGGEGELRLIHRDGTNRRVLVPSEKGGSIAPFDWSTDGRFIAGLGPVGPKARESKNPLQIVRVEAATGGVTVIKELPVRSDNVQISLSPDGRFVAYDTKPRWKDAQSAPPSQLYTVEMDGSNNRLLLDHPAACASPYWTPDGGHLIFESNRSGEAALWSVAMKGGAAAGEPRLIRGGFGGTRILGFTADGTLHYAASTPRMNIFVAGVDFEQRTIQPPRLVSLRHDGKNLDPAWSPDGKQLGYVSARSAGWPPPGALVFQEISTGKEREVEVAALNFFSSPHWSPDLTKVVGPAKVPGRNNNSRALYVVDAKTGQRSLLLDQDASSAHVSQDGHYLVYRRHLWEGPEAGGQLVERDLRSGTERVILRRKDSGFNDAVRLSPDETKLAYCEKPYSTNTTEKTTLILTLRADGASRNVWEIGQVEASVLDWLPDSQRLIVSVSDKEGTQQLHLIDTETGGNHKLGQPLKGEEKIRQLAVHPDGKQIAISRGGVQQEIWTIKNMVAKPKEERGVLGHPAASPSGKDGQAVIHKSNAESYGRNVASVDSSISPNGRYLAYVNWGFGNLGVCDTWTGERRDLTTEGTWDSPSQFAWRSVWSPDSQQIAFVWYKGEGVELRVVNRNGGKSRLLVPSEKAGGIHPWQWSKDGRFIIGLAPLENQPNEANKIRQIVRVDVESGAVTKLKELRGANDSVSGVLSPDGKHILYSFPAGELHLMEVDGSAERTVLQQPTNARQLVWMPDGKHVLFVSERSGMEALWALPIKDHEAAGPPILIREGFFHSWIFGASDDGTLAWFTATPRANIFVAKADLTSSTIQAGRHISMRFDGRSRHPSWSLDGTELTYVSRQYPGSTDATHVFHNVASGKERDVRIPSHGYWGPPQWSQDNRRMYGRVYLEGKDSYRLCEWDAQTGQLSMMGDGLAGAPQLTPDGRHLIVLRESGSGTNLTTEIVERDLGSGQERVIRRGHLANGLTKMNTMKCLNPILSPNGTRIAYLEGSGTNTVLQLVDRFTGASEVICPIASWRGTILDWFPDNRQLLVSVEDGDSQQLHIVDTQTKSMRPFLQPLHEHDRIHQASIHPDGEQIAFCRSGGINEVWTMKNFLADQKRVAE